MVGVSEAPIGGQARNYPLGDRVSMGLAARAAKAQIPVVSMRIGSGFVTHPITLNSHFTLWTQAGGCVDRSSTTEK